MKNHLTFLLVLLPSLAWAQNYSTKVYPDPVSGELIYTTDTLGNRVPDYSIAGYQNGEIPIPDASVVATLSPLGGRLDDLPQIQAAIDSIEQAIPVGSDGLRDAILLTSGVYRITNSINLQASGIVLRGEGDCKDGTVIIHDKQPDLSGISIKINGGNGRVSGPKVAILNGFLPVGEQKLLVADASGFAPGDRVSVRASQTQKWIDSLGMTAWWNPSSYSHQWIRKVLSVSGDTLVLDAGVNSQVDQANGYATSATIEKITADNRARHMGVEDLVLMSTYDRSIKDSNGYYIDEDHVATAIQFIGGADYWVRGVTGYFYKTSLIRADKYTYRITVEDCAMIDGVSLDNVNNHAGGRDYSFNMGGTTLLCQRNYSRNGRHSFVMASGDGNVVLDSYADKEHLSTEPHQNYTTGALFDNVRTDGIFKLNRVDGSHGQRAANCALWNVTSYNQRYWEGDIQLDAAPNNLANNWAIGIINNGTGNGIQTPGPESVTGDPAFVESVGQHVTPRSLYFAQLQDRLGSGAVANVASAEQFVSAEAVWDIMKYKYDQIPEFGDWEDLSWMPTCKEFEQCGLNGNDPAMIKNGTFSQSLMCPWVFMNSGDSAMAEVVNGALVIDMEVSGTNSWEPQVVQEGFALDSGVTYTLTFEAKANRPMDFQLQINAGPGNYKLSLIDTVRLVPHMKQYIFCFNAIESDNNARLDFNFGGNSNKVITLDNVVLEEATGEQCHQSPEHQKRAEVVLYPNPTFGQLSVRLLHHRNALDSVPLIIRNSLGEVVYETVITEDTVIDISHLEQGMYYVKAGNQIRRIFKL